MSEHQQLMRHAPGPWVLSETETRVAIKSGKRTVAYVQMARDDYENANLIVAAPEMLGALRLAATILEGAIHPALRRPDDGLSQIKAVIAKATSGASV